VFIDGVVAAEAMGDLGARVGLLDRLEDDHVDVVWLNRCRQALDDEAGVTITDRAGALLEDQRRRAPVANLDRLCGPSDEFQV
jgi:hypothetical protein